jgi:hypothetical protein
LFYVFLVFFLFLISTSRHNTTNFLSLTKQQQHNFPLTHLAAAPEAAPAAAAAAAAPPPHIDVQNVVLLLVEHGL